MARATLTLALCIATGCGRVGYDSLEIGEPAPGVFERVPLPPGGLVEGVAPGAEPGQVYAFFWAGRVFRSDDAGQVWVECAPAVGDAMAVAADGTVYLAANYSEVLASTDGCQTWQPTGLELYAANLAVSEGRVFAATERGLRAADGEHWEVIDSPFEGMQLHGVAVHDSAILISSAAGVARSDDGGIEWTSSDTRTRIVSLAISPSNPARAWAIERSGGGTTGAVLRSDDGGLSWEMIYDNGGYFIAVNPDDPDHALIASYTGLFETTDGSTIADIRTPEMSLADVFSVVFDGAGGAYAATARGVFYRDLPGPFVPRHGALDVWGLVAGAAVPASDTIYWATRAGLLRSVDGGATYTLSTEGSVLTSNCTDVHVPAARSDVVFTSSRHVRLSRDRGATFENVYDSGPANNYGVNALASAGSRLFGATRTQVIYADEPWTKWTGVLLDGAPRDVHDIAALDGGVVVAIAASGVYESSDGGESFRPIPLSPPDPRRLFPAPDGALLVGTREGLWSYRAEAWTRLEIDVRVNDLLMEGGTWIAATATGVFVSRDAGRSFTEMPGLADLGARSLVRDAAGDLLVGTSAHGLFRAPLP